MSRRSLRLVALSAAALAGMAAPAAASSGDPRVVELETVRVQAPGNPSVAVVPFTDAVYPSCADVPESPRGCQEVGRVDYRYGIGRLEVTVSQWVAFLNTVDPAGRDPHGLYDATQSASAWPKYGQVNLAEGAPNGEHYSVASPEWADKPYGFANFLRAARFVNSLSNGQVLARRATATGISYRVRLSRQTERGMYDLADGPRATRTSSAGFAVPSQDEWIKAAYYDPRGGGTYSYWKYPTNPGVFADGTATAPGATVLNASTGDVTNAGTQPLATYHPKGGAAPTWCPAAVSPDDCASVNPFGIDPTTYARMYQGNLSTVGQARSASPWGTLDQGGNAVEWTDTITPPPARDGSTRVWRRLHGGVTNAGAYQMWPSAIGLQPQDNAFFDRTYPWLGFRIGVIGDPKPHRARTRAAAPSGGAARALYVANRPADGPTSLAQLSVAVPGGAASPLTPPTVAADPEPQHVAVTSDARFAYASAAGAGVVDAYRVRARDGVLEPLGSAPAAPGAHGVVVAPDDRSVYVANQDAGTVSQYDVGAGGSLTPKTPAGVPAGQGASGVAVTPDGRSVYVTNLDAGTVSQYDVNPASGTLAPKSPAAIRAPARPSGIGVSPEGRSLYVASLSGGLAQYDIDPGSGRLRPMSPATVRVGIGAAGVAITPDGRFLYTPNGGANSASQFAIDRRSGQLTPLRPAAVPAGARPEGVAVTPDGRTLYVVDADGAGVSRFAIDPRTGRLAAGGFAATGPNPHGAVVTPDQSPVAHLAVDPVVGVGEAVHLDGSASRDPDGRVARYAWSFGDGRRAVGEASTAVHRYNRPGRYRVTLKITDDEGCSARRIYTGQTASCAGDAAAIAVRHVTVR